MIVCGVQDHGPMCACAEARRQYQMASSITIEQSSLFLTGMGGQQAPQDPSVAPLTCTVVAGACHRAWLATWVQSFMVT